MKKTILSLLMVAALSLTSLSTRPAQTPGPPLQEVARFFPETGHNVRGPFLLYFETRGGESSFGFPITEDFIDPHSQRLVQYFQNVRMEWHPENPDPYKVQLGLLGDQLGKGRPRLAARRIPSSNNPDCYYFAETGHSVCYAFLDFFRLSGGVDIFGYPISEFELENGRIVQYFQRTRMEWHPERSLGQKVAVGPLGFLYFDFKGLDPDLLGHVRPLTFGRERVTALHLTASVSEPVMKPGGRQTVFLVVLNQYDQPLSNAEVKLRVEYPSHQERFTLPPTSAEGVTRLAFDVVAGESGRDVVLEFTVSAGGLTRTTTTSFLIWY